MLRSWHPDLADHIRQARESSRLTQLGLAQTLGISDRAVSFWECKKRRPTPTMMMKTLNALFGFVKRCGRATRKKQLLNIIDTALEEGDFWQRIGDGQLDLLAEEFPGFAAKIRQLIALDYELATYLAAALEQEDPKDMR